MSRRISTQPVRKEKGYLYYLGKDGYIWASPMKHNKSGTKKRVGTEKLARPKGMCWVGASGYLETK
jgi:hypothetical protein